MIHASVHRTPEGSVGEIKLSITAESIPLFTALIDRALNCWDSAPAELKELGDMLTHGRITQNHEFVPINTKQNTDYRSAEELAILRDFIDTNGVDTWIKHLSDGTLPDCLKR